MTLVILIVHSRGIVAERKIPHVDRRKQAGRRGTISSPSVLSHATFGKSITVSLTRLIILVNRIALMAWMLSTICRSV